MSDLISGIFLFDKPSGITSHDAVDILRRKINIRRIGHTGTLDPMATGLLVMLVGGAVKLQAKLQHSSKSYEGVIRLGIETDTWDMEGKILKEMPLADLNYEKVKKIVSFLDGRAIQQVPPFSAVRYKGRPLYKLARKNQTVPVIRREVDIKWKNFSFKSPDVHFKIECSGGTYIRSIAREMGRMLGCGACLCSLRRTKIGRWKVEDAVSAEKLKNMSREEVSSGIFKIPHDIE
ncbi:MAG: tRNA pseudouridine(55) synthase TruB [Elusimicrobia bacterium]|nr:tRNA pseudouridine(55) synthase TruB [Elusimicrobiota bacterium]